jgi:hypothetical protein
LAEFTDSIVESPRRHASTQKNSTYGSATCAIPHTL